MFTPRASYWIAVAGTLWTTFVLVFGIGALGVIADEGDRADMMYLGVLAVLAVGALMVRFQPTGMAAVLTATAVATVVVAVIAMIMGRHNDPATSIWELLGLTAMFCVGWLLSAFFFRRAGVTVPA